jgi:hypothetical protein
MNSKNQIDALRNIDLEEVLLWLGAKKDHYDKSKWHTAKGTVSLNGRKFFNWSKNKGGGGAIDLVMHLGGTDFRQTILWLQHNFSLPQAKPSSVKKAVTQHQFILPQKVNANMRRVFQYLHYQRCIPQKMIYSLVRSGQLYADERHNAVFVLLGKEKKAVGAELVGTSCRWKGIAPGSRKNLGGFYMIRGRPDHIVLCESAIDTVSYCALHSDCMALSTAGVSASPAWLPGIINLGLEVYCGFDADDVGDCMANKMIEKHPAIQRKKPPQKDWNEVLVSRSALL